MAPNLPNIVRVISADRYGHALGDETLILVARAIRNCCRASDFVCRYGGEDFAVLLHSDLTGGYEAAERIRLTVAQINVPREQGGRLGVTVSIGLAVRETGETWEE